MRRYAAVGVVAGLLLLAGCTAQQPYVKDGKEYGITKGTFRGRWWAYYERGSSFLAGEFLEQAEADFKKALAGRSRDAWAARTYGLHFVEYFPNRELGVAYYHMGRLDEAEQSLKTSLEQVDTVRARYYLDQITKKRLELGELDDVATPALAAAVGAGRVVPSRRVALEIQASDDLGVEEVTVDGRPLHQRGSAAEVRFEDDLLLAEGAHSFEVQASDLAGKASTETVEVTVDLTGPAIGILSPALPLVTEEASVRLRGAAMDANGVLWVRLGEATLAESPGTERLDFETELPLRDGDNAFVIIARDTAGNETSTALSVFRGRPGSPEASLWLLEQRFGGSIQIAALSPEHLPSLLMAAAAEPAPPLSIQVKFPHQKTNIQEYRKEEIRLAGRVEAQEGLSTFRIQDDTYPVIPEARQIEFSRRIPIAADEENPIHVEAADTAGRREEWETTIIGKPVLLDDWKMKVAIQHFEGVDEPSQQYLRTLLEGKLFEVKHHRFEVVDRTQLDAVLLELQMGAGDLADPNFALNLGKIKPADIFLYGVIYPRGESGIEILIRVISTETATILASYDTFITNWNDSDERTRKTGEIAEWLAGAFPRLPCSIARVAANIAWIDLGEEDGVRKGMKAVVAQEVAPAELDPNTGEVLEEAIYDALGWAAVVAVEAKRSKLDQLMVVLEGETPVSVSEGQPAFTM